MRVSSARARPVVRLPKRVARIQDVGRGVLPGLALAAAVGLAVHLAAERIFPYALAVGFEVPMAMLSGLVLVNVGLVPAQAEKGIQFAVQRVLRLGIILLGLRLNLETIVNIGAGAFGLILVSMAAALVFAVIVGRRLGLPARLAVLIGVGTAVCGNSAIVAAAPAVKADDREVSFAVTTITVFGTLAVFVYPLIGHALQLDVLTFGLWAGTAVHDTAQTIAASTIYSTVGRDVATVVKLVRNALMAPLLLLIIWAWSRYGDREGVSKQAARRGARKAFPLFLLGFLALSVVRTTHLIDPEAVSAVDLVTRACFVVALAGLGLQTRLGHLVAIGIRPFLVGLTTAALLAGGSLAIILGLGIGPARTKAEGGIDPRLGTRGWTEVCVRGSTTPAFAGAWLRMAQPLAAEMGAPVGCATVDQATGDTVQLTTRGRATLRAASGLATFNDAEHTWAVQDTVLLDWSGQVPDPPPGARVVPLDPVMAPHTATDVRSVRLSGRLIAVGIPGAGAISPVGVFHPGGPFHDKREFANQTRTGEVLDPSRLLVASTSNFGAPRARADWASGAILSLSTTDSAEPLLVPGDFAATGVQPRGQDGRVRLYTAQAPAFFNQLSTPQAVTADMPAVANPLGISVNNAFGRPWFANAPTGSSGAGIETVLDPDGRPLANAPSERAGGVFAEALTNRLPQVLPGALQTGAVGNALLGASPDGTNRAVFAVATADGGLVQVQVEQGVDGLAPAGTLAPLGHIAPQATHATPPAATRVGMVFNWVPDRFLYVTDPYNDAIVQLHLSDDLQVFQVAETRRLASPYFSLPIDLAPAVTEIANPAFSSNTTLAGGADLYVANRGSGTISRLRQDGKVVAVAQVEVPGVGDLGPGRLNGIAVSPDAQKIWVTVDGPLPTHPNLPGAVIELPAFGAT